MAWTITTPARNLADGLTTLTLTAESPADKASDADKLARSLMVAAKIAHRDTTEDGAPIRGYAGTKLR